MVNFTLTEENVISDLKVVEHLLMTNIKLNYRLDAIYQVGLTPFQRG